MIFDLIMPMYHFQRCVCVCIYIIHCFREILMLLFDSGSDRVKQETQFYQSQHESLAAALTLINIS